MLLHHLQEFNNHLGVWPDEHLQRRCGGAPTTVSTAPGAANRLGGASQQRGLGPAARECTPGASPASLHWRSLCTTGAGTGIRGQCTLRKGPGGVGWRKTRLQPSEWRRRPTSTSSSAGGRGGDSPWLRAGEQTGAAWSVGKGATSHLRASLRTLTRIRTGERQRVSTGSEALWPGSKVTISVGDDY